MEESGEEEGVGDVRRDLKLTNIQELSTLPGTSHHVTHNGDGRACKKKQTQVKKSFHRAAWNKGLVLRQYSYE